MDKQISKNRLFLQQYEYYHDYIMPYLSPSEQSIISTVIHLQAFENKDWEIISNTLFQIATGLSRRTVITSIASVLDKKVIIRGIKTQYGYAWKFNLSIPIEAVLNMQNAKLITKIESPVSIQDRFKKLKMIKRFQVINNIDVS